MKYQDFINMDVNLKEFENVSFFETPKLYIPILPPYLQGQRPL